MNSERIMAIFYFALSVLALLIVCYSFYKSIRRDLRRRKPTNYYAVEYINRAGSSYTLWDLAADTPEDAMAHVRNWYGIDHIQTVSLRTNPITEQIGEYRVVYKHWDDK